MLNPAQNQNGSPRDHLRWFLPLLLVFLCIYFHWLGVFARFHYDDIPLIVENSGLRSWNGLWEILKSGRPMRGISFWVDYRIWGLDAGGFHLTNILLHSLAGLCAYWLLRLLFQRRSPAFIASLIFIVHPANTEAVIGIANRKELLCFLCMALSFICFLKSGRRALWLFFSLAFYCLALISKQVALALPFLILLSSLTLNKPEAKSWKRLALQLGLFILIPVAAFLFRFSDFKLFGSLASQDLAGAAYPKIIATQISCFPTYLKLGFFPAHLRVNYYVPVVENLLSARVIAGALAFVLAFTLLAWMVIRKSELGFGWGWFLISLLPVMNWIPANTFIAERYVYIPLFGASALIALLLENASASLGPVLSNDRRKLLLLVFSDMLFLFVLFPMQITHRQQQIWYELIPSWMPVEHSSLLSGLVASILAAAAVYFFYRKAGHGALWEFLFSFLVIAAGYMVCLLVINRLSFNFWGLPRPDVHYIYSVWNKFLAENAVDKPAHFMHNFPHGTLFSEAVNLFFYIFFLNGLGFFIYNRLAMKRARTAPQTMFTWLLIWVIYLVMAFQTANRFKDWGWEVSLWKSEVKENPYSCIGWNNLGRAYVDRKKFDDAIDCFIMAHSLEPYSLEPILNLGTVMAMFNRMEDAEHYYQWALLISPYSFLARLNLGNCFASQGDYNQAIEQYTVALQIKPDSFEAYYGLAYAFYALGDHAKAFLYAQKALAIAPTHQPSKSLIQKLMTENPER